MEDQLADQQALRRPIILTIIETLIMQKRVNSI